MFGFQKIDHRGDNMKKRYLIEISDKKGKFHMKRECEGFSPFELLGILEHTQLDILKQMAGEIKPDIVKRTVVTKDLT